MSNNARRVVLLARPGVARERMREALSQAGANVVLEADPTTTDQAAILASQPEAALIVLDAATDEALERFDDLLSNPKIEVFFEEAEHAIGRVGWDAARWVRHLSAKLRHTDSVLPPERASSDAPVSAAAPQAVTPQVAAPQPSFAQAAPPQEATPRVEVPSAALQRATLPESPAAAPPAAAESIAQIAPVDVHSDMDLVTIELGDEAAHYAQKHNAEAPSSFVSKLELELVDETPTEVKIEGLERAEHRPTTEIKIEGLELEEDHPSDIKFEGLSLEGDHPSGIRFEGLSLEEEQPSGIKMEGLSLEEDHPSDASRFRDDMADLHSRMAAMELVEDRVAAPMRGAVLVLAGIGGPDAVRQLLGALPAGFPRAVLIQQRLDGGHYDKLVAQMQRATTLPVRLAVAGDELQAATIYILPPALGVRESGQGLAFVDSSIDVLAGLPAGDSAVLMLSGSDATQVDAVMKLGAAGAMIAAQALDGCYDVAAPAALASRGGQAGKPQELARRLAERWH